MSGHRPKVKRKLLNDLEKGELDNSNQQKQKRSKTDSKSKKMVEKSPKQHKSKTTQRGKKIKLNQRNKLISVNNNAIAIPTKVVPIIQMRRMKAKELNKDSVVNSNITTKSLMQSDKDKLNNIDLLTTREITDGDNLDVDDTIYNDGVELTIQGSDLEDDFPENDRVTLEKY